MCSCQRQNTLLFDRPPTRSLLPIRPSSLPACLLHSLYESLICNEFIADLEVEGPALLPQDAAQRARARLLIDQASGSSRGGGTLTGASRYKGWPLTEYGKSLADPEGLLWALGLNT